MKYKALRPFSAFGYTAMPDKILEISDKGQALDLIRLDWIQAMEYEVSEDSNAKEIKKTTKRVKE